MTVYVVAVSRKEAEELSAALPYLRHPTRKSANAHLRDVQQPPTDAFYASQYKVWPVRVED